MSEHLTLERLSAVLDEPGANGSAVTHLDACAACQREYEAMSRMRMSLSGLAELEAPAGAWNRIEAALPAAPVAEDPPVIEFRPRRRAFGLLTAWPLQAAAALILFAGGLALGVRLRQTGMTEVPAVASSQDGGAVRSASDAGQASYQDALTGLEELRLRTVSTGANPADDPAADAARLIYLDALVTASREALRESPEDPAVNNFLFEVIDERDALNAQLSDVLHAATAEYR
jgi:hypothetical protein